MALSEFAVMASQLDGGEDEGLWKNTLEDSKTGSRDHKDIIQHMSEEFY